MVPLLLKQKTMKEKKKHGIYKQLIGMKRSLLWTMYGQISASLQNYCWQTQ